MTDSAHGEPSALIELVEMFDRMRRECAWKAEQTHESLVKYLREESEEVIEAIGSGDPERLKDELGDVLLQVYFHAAIAAQAGEFTIEDVARGLRDKMIRRNPHVFGPNKLDDPAEITAQWNRIKAEERTVSDRATDQNP